MRITRTNKLYNYLINTYGLSKEVVLEHVNLRLDDLVSRHVAKKFDTKSVESMIINKITQYIKTGSTDQWYDKSSFESFVKSCIKDEVSKIVKESYKIKVELK